MDVAIVAVGIPHTREHAQQLAIAASQIVPVFLLAAIAVPLRIRARTADGAHGHPGFFGRGFPNLALTALVVGSALCTEYAALFGTVAGGLSRHDVHLLERLLAATLLLCSVRILAPVVESYAEQTRSSEWKVWGALVVLIVLAFFGLLLGMNTAD